jgi:hypothetical protein
MLVFGMKAQNRATPSEKEAFSYNVIYFLVFACTISFLYQSFATVIYLYRKAWLVFIETDLFKRNFPEKHSEYLLAKTQGEKLLKSIDPKAKEILKNLIKGYKANKSLLRPTEQDKVNPNLPVKYKITYFNRSESASSTISHSTLSKLQRKQMIKEIFDEREEREEGNQRDGFEEVMQHSEATIPDYEEYEEEITIRAKDL